MSTSSRYDFMKEGTVKDEITGSLYPDPLSLNYLDFELATMPSHRFLTEDNIQNFLMTMSEEYGSEEYDDMVLTLNGCSHSNFLQTGDLMYFPAIKDIKRSFNKTR